MMLMSLEECLHLFTAEEGEDVMVRVVVTQRAVVPLALLLSPRDDHTHHHEP